MCALPLSFYLASQAKLWFFALAERGDAQVSSVIFYFSLKINIYNMETRIDKTYECDKRILYKKRFFIL